MWHFLFSFYSGPLVALGVLVAVACLACSWYINRLQADLARTIRQDAAAMEAADDLQVQLRHLRVHSLVLVADQTDARREVVQGDLARVDAALAAIHQTATTRKTFNWPNKSSKTMRTVPGQPWARPAPLFAGPMSDLARWSDAHHME